jgi:hypothetical protein
VLPARKIRRVEEFLQLFPHEKDLLIDVPSVEHSVQAMPKRSANTIQANKAVTPVKIC